MLQYVVAKDHIKGVVVKRDVVYIHLHFGERGLNVSGDVIQVGNRLKSLNKAMLWSDMKHLEGSGKKVGFLL